MDAYETGYMFGFVLGLFVIFLIPAIFFLISQQNILKAIQPQNRTMSPGEVWLQLIPIFNFVWCFIVVNRIAESIRRELTSRIGFSFEENQSPVSYYESTEKPTQQVGIAMCVLYCCGIIPVIGVAARIAALVCWIVYWVKLGQYRKQIINRNYTYLDPMQQSNSSHL